MTEPTDQERVDGTVRAARDSVWVITDELQKKADRGELTAEGRGNIDNSVAPRVGKSRCAGTAPL